MTSEEPLPRSTSTRYQLGALCVLGAFLIFAAALVDWLFVLPFRMPATWYYQQHLWLGSAVALVLLGWVLQVPPPAVDGWQPRRSGMRFLRLRVFGRPDCHLCDEAVDILEKYEAWLPPIELLNVDEDPELKERYGLQIPVVECDGKVRFLGKVNETLLRRLIEGTPPL